MATTIADYALIGDCETAALVSRDGSIDWLCWPRFDSDACFAALLGTPDNGRWRIAPTTEKFRVSRQYRQDTLILETRFETDEGVGHADRLHAAAQRHVRLDAAGGRRIRPRDDVHGAGCSASATAASFRGSRRLPDRTLRAVAGPDMVVLRTPIETRGENFKTVGEFTVSAGETVPFTLIYSPSHLPPPERDRSARRAGDDREILARLDGEMQS